MSHHGIIQASLISAVPAALPLLYAGLGELIGEKAGVINIGIEGVMLMGAVAGFAATYHSHNVILGLLAGSATGALFAALFVAIPAVMMGAPQILVGLGAWFIGTGLSSQLGTSLTGNTTTVRPAHINIPLLDKIPFVNDIFFKQIWPVYFAILLAVVIWFVLTRTRHGLNIRSVGEDPSAAYAAGVPVRLIQTLGVTLGGALMGMAGAVFSVAIAGTWQGGLTGGRGFIAFALVIFVGWRPLALIGAAYLFGIFLILVDVGQSHGWSINSSFLTMIPYLLTVVALAIRAAYEKRQRTRPAAPAALGTIFIRGEK
jgi:simple sugar transport system permease protein